MIPTWLIRKSIHTRNRKRWPFVPVKLSFSGVIHQSKRFWSLSWSGSDGHDHGHIMSYTHRPTRLGWAYRQFSTGGNS